MTFIDLDAIDAAQLQTDPFDFLVVPGCIGPQALERISADYPAIERPGNLSLDDIRYGGAFRQFLGEFEQLLLFAVVGLGDDAYGVGLRQTLEERTGRRVSPGAVYTALDRLEAKGLVRSWLGEDTPARGGRRRKFFALTPAGAAQLLDSYTALQRMAEDLIPTLRDLAVEGRSG